MASALVIAVIAFALTLFVGKWWVRFAYNHNIRKRIRSDGPESHLAKMGTPTMGGMMIVVGVLLVTVLLNHIDAPLTLLSLAVMVSFAVLGGLDDSKTLLDSSPKTYGIAVRHKFWLMAALAFLTSTALYMPPPLGLAHTNDLQVPVIGGLRTGPWFIPIAALIIVFVSNSVNLTDGLDGLAGWNVAVAFAAYAVLAFLSSPPMPSLMTFCLTIAGACAAFLWYNAYPAQIIMGDLGALALGATLATVALESQHLLLLPVVGLVIFAEGLSVLLQVSYFKVTKRRFGAGRRLFKMAPMHHHFELIGWSQVQVMQRFVLISIIAAIVGISLALGYL